MTALRKPEVIGVITAGGDAPGMNAAIRAVVRAALSHGLEVIGIRRGYRGVYEKDFFVMNSRHVSGIINLGGTILKSVRFPEFQRPEVRWQAARNLQEAKIDALVVIGGDGSCRGALALSETSGFPVVTIPASIDNDIAGTDITVGFDTAVNTAVEAIDRIRDTATSHDRTFVIEVMGRHCGNLALAVGLACGAEIVLIPERPSNEEAIFQEVESADRKGKESVLIILAEGAGRAAELTEVLSRRFPDKEVRYAVLGYVQRGGRPCSASRNLATRLGVKAVEGLLAGKTCHLVAWVKGAVTFVPLSEVVQGKPKVSLEYLDLVKLLSI
ncbi:MAG: 6-phosphofructokinase [Candidatus Omnitrophica bacterium]|nr:6-phosphofructokinase [Candidatus Omnitrophota bacterium]